MESDDVSAFSKFLTDWRVIARNPDFQLGIHVESPGGFDRKLSDRFVRDRVIFDFFAGEALLVDEDKAEVGEDEIVTDDFEGDLNLLAFDEDGGKFLIEFCRVDLR